MNLDLTFKFKNYKGKISAELAAKQNLTQERVDQLKQVYFEEHKTFEKMKKTDDPVKLKKLAANIEKYEFLKQKIWGFPLDRNNHRWFDVPKCTCPKMDNQARLGTIYRDISSGCPVHGVLNEV